MSANVRLAEMLPLADWEDGPFPREGRNSSRPLMECQLLDKREFPMCTKTATADLDQAVLNDLKSRINALGSNAKYLRTCASEIREVIAEQKVSVDKVCFEANRALKGLGGKPVTPADIKALLDELDAPPRRGSDVFSASFRSEALLRAGMSIQDTRDASASSKSKLSRPLFKPEELNTHVPYKAPGSL